MLCFGFVSLLLTVAVVRPLSCVLHVLNLLMLVGVISMKRSLGGALIFKKKTVKGWYYIRVLIHCRVCTYACTEGDVRLVLDILNLTESMICWVLELQCSGIRCLHRCIGTVGMLHKKHMVTPVQYLSRP